MDSESQSKYISMFAYVCVFMCVRLCMCIQLGKQCQELLMTVAVNCHAHSPEDVKVIEALVNIRLKTKLFSSQFIACIK